MDWTEALNVAFALTGWEYSTSRANEAVTYFGEAASDALAMWVFFCPSLVAMGCLTDWLHKKKMGTLGGKKKITMTFKDIIELQNAHPGLVKTVFQRAGDCVTIPTGWAHQVINLRPNIKVAWERVRRGHMALYAIQLVKLTTRFFGRMAPDYVAIRKVMFEDVRRAYGEYTGRACM
ncbi:MAG: hypothetical protein J3K34DRAFT_436334 [Monoraphidium minutum]|nr:MAG: hypothetical protein J3K34DRAFT_436334 [Monoraphidium minutum]